MCLHLHVTVLLRVSAAARLERGGSARWCRERATKLGGLPSDFSRQGLTTQATKFLGGVSFACAYL